MKISVQLWKSSDDSRYVLMRHYAKWLWFEETRDEFEQTDKTLSSQTTHTKVPTHDAKQRHCDVKTTSRRRIDVIMTLLLRRVPFGFPSRGFIELRNI